VSSNQIGDSREYLTARHGITVKRRSSDTALVGVDEGMSLILPTIRPAEEVRKPVRRV
jgi:hypothetical protein